MADVIDKRATGNEGKELLASDLPVPKDLKIGASPTWVGNNKRSSARSQEDRNMFDGCSKFPSFRRSTLVSRCASLQSQRGWPRYPALLCGVAALLVGACNDTRRPPLEPAAGLANGSAAAAAGKNPARDKLQDWLLALNTADPGQIRRVNEGATPGAALLTSRTLTVADSTGGFDLKSSVLFEATPTTRVVKLQSRRTSAWHCLAFSVEPEPPHAIAFMFVSPTAAPSAPSGAQEPVGTLLDATARQAILRAIVSALSAGYIYPEKVAAVESSLNARQANHAYDAIQSRTTFAQVLTRDIFQVLHDRHVNVGVSCSVSAEPARAEPPPLDPAIHPRVFGETKRLAGDVAYVEVRSFGAPAELARAEIQKVMSAIADANALLLDIRSNPGGNPETLALLSSYLFDEARVHLNSLVWRGATTTQDFFTDPRVKGPKFGSKKPVYVLAGGGTFSAAEEFAYNLQSLKRAQIVGEATGGGAHPGGSAPLPYGLSLRVPSGRAINPVTKTNWEQTGVRPDVPVAADQALEAAHKLALERVAAAHSVGAANAAK